MPPYKIPSLLLVFSLFLASCGGPTEQVYIDQYKPLFDEKRAQLAEIANALPTSPVQESTCPSFDPPFVMSIYADSPINTGMIMEESLLNPYATTQFFLSDPGDFLVPFQRTSDDYSQWQRELEADASYAQDFEDVLDYDYLTINRVLQWQEPQVLDGSTYIPGAVSMDGFIVSLANNNVLCAYHVDAVSDDELDYEYEVGTDGLTEASTAAWESIQNNIATALTEKLQAITGTEVTLW